MKLAMEKIRLVNIIVKYRWKKSVGVSVCIRQFSDSVLTEKSLAKVE
jgi:hypothetical protein